MKIVVDSNVLLSAALGPGAPSEVVELVLIGKVDVVFSRETFGEFVDVLMTRRPFTSLPANVRGAFVGHLAERGTWRASVSQPVKCRDPRDQPLLDLAVSGGADYLVTGDDDLRSLEQVGGVRIRTPREFLRETQKP